MLAQLFELKTDGGMEFEWCIDDSSQVIITTDNTYNEISIYYMKGVTSVMLVNRHTTPLVLEYAGGSLQAYLSDHHTIQMIELSDNRCEIYLKGYPLPIVFIPCTQRTLHEWSMKPPFIWT